MSDAVVTILGRRVFVKIFLFDVAALRRAASAAVSMSRCECGDAMSLDDGQTHPSGRHTRDSRNRSKLFRKRYYDIVSDPIVRIDWVMLARC